MDDVAYEVSRFDGAVMLLPYTLRDDARKLIKKDRAEAEEIRLRIGRSPTVITGGEEIILRREAVSKREIDWVMDIVTQASAHSVSESLRTGYITIKGGYRIGICGTTLVQNGLVTGMRNISSLSIRVSRQIKGIADELADLLVCNNVFKSTLIISQPGGGKTTLLRDLARTLSNGDKDKKRLPFRVGIADERSEIAAVWDGSPQMDVGEHTDVIDACPKAAAMNMLLRAMNPQIIVADEITQMEDIEAITRISHCGTGIMATAHAGNIGDMKKRPLYRQLIESSVFEKVIIIRKTDGGRKYEAYDMEESICSE